MTAAEKAVAWAKDIAADDLHGYDQANRWGPDYDCSSLVITAYQRAGVPLTCTYTGNMRADMLAHGFHIVTDGTLQAGDVLLNEKSHTALYIGSGMLVQAGSNERGGITGGQPGDQTGKEICIRSYYSFPWDCVLRYGSEETAEPDEQGGPFEYIVQKGDMLWTLAERFLGAGYKYTEILGANSLTTTNLMPGQKLIIPRKTAVELTQVLKLSVPASRVKDVLPTLRAAGIQAEAAT